MEFSSGRGVVYRAHGAGWITIFITERRSADTYLLGGKHKGGKHKVPIENMALRRPFGGDLNPDRGPIKRHR
eukprot:5813717-Pyramimonas_sp.AAC.1